MEELKPEWNVGRYGCEGSGREWIWSGRDEERRGETETEEVRAWRVLFRENKAVAREVKLNCAVGNGIAVVVKKTLVRHDVAKSR
jgi:hypothetical protein